MSLVNQPSAWPTRKVWATGIATFFVMGSLYTMDIFLPGIVEVAPAAEWIERLSLLIVALPTLSAYMTRERG